MTDTKQPEALRLAVIHEFLAEQSKHDEEKTIIVQLFKDSAIELRRLHEVNQMLLEALKEICDCPQYVDEATVPKAGIEAAPQQVVVNMSVALVRLRKVRAAIAKAEESK
jgi:hypothetical protein